jgi:hypothetical protein
MMPPDRHRLPKAALLWLFLAFGGVFGLTAHGYLENTDAEITMHAARAWWLRGSPGLVGAGRQHLLADGETTWPAEQAIVGLIEDPTLPRYGRMGIDQRAYIWFPIGHQALFVPAIAIAGVIDSLWPDGEQRFRAAKNDPVFGQFFWSRFVASLVSPLAAAGTAIALLILALSLGARPRDAVLATIVTCMCTQFWPGSRETLSDMPGTFFLAAAAAAIARYGVVLTPSTLFLGGLLGGLGVLVRYPQALPLCGLGAWALWQTWRTRRVFDFAWFVVGGVPALALLVYANVARFGDPGETGYSGGVGFLSYPLHMGLPLILLAFGKGILWFSPPLWTAFAQFRKATVRGVAASWFALLTLVAPLPLYGTLHYWAAGQCWGIRYLTGVIAIFVLVALAIGRPWRSSPRAFAAIALAGFAINLGGMLTPYVGHQQLAYVAARQEWGPVQGVDNNVNFEPRYSPLHGHWTYAWLAATNRLASGRSADTTEPLFGVRVDGKVPAPAPENRDFRHVWWRYVEFLWPGFPGWIAASIGAILSALAFLLGVRALSRDLTSTVHDEATDPLES